MLNLDNKYMYNALFDILYVRLVDSKNSYGHEEEDGIVINYDYDTKKVVGADIWDFKSRYCNNEPINLPFVIDFDAVIQNIDENHVE